MDRYPAYWKTSNPGRFVWWSQKLTCICQYYAYNYIHDSYNRQFIYMYVYRDCMYMYMYMNIYIISSDAWTESREVRVGMGLPCWGELVWSLAQVLKTRQLATEIEKVCGDRVAIISLVFEKYLQSWKKAEWNCSTGVGGFWLISISEKPKLRVCEYGSQNFTGETILYFAVLRF